MEKIIIIDSISCVKMRLEPQIGPLIIRDILSEEFETELISFTTQFYLGEIELLPTIDENIEQFSRTILEKKPQAVSFYTMCDSFYISVKLAQKVKEKSPDIKIVMGGPHATLIARDILTEFEFVDVVAMGEGEKTALNIFSALFGKIEMDNLYGIAYRNAGKIQINPLPELISEDELSKYQPKSFSPYALDKFSGMSIEGGRGCPFGCTFCSTKSFWGRKYRIKPINDLIAEMDRLEREYGFDYFVIQHDLFTVNKKKVLNFCNRLIDEKKRYSWGCSSRVDVLDYELIEQMAAAKCKDVFLGIETGSERMQVLLNKNLKFTKAYEIMEYMLERGLEVTLSFIFCYPEETLEDFEQTARMIERCFLMGIKNIALHMFMLLPKTEETNKVFDKSFFNEKQLETSIFSSGLYTDSSIQFIQEHKSCFIQFYSFDSEVRERYGSFNVFVEILQSVQSIYKFAIRMLLEKKGIINLYDENIEIIKNVKEEINSKDFTAIAENRFKVCLNAMKEILGKYDSIREELSREQIEVLRFEDILCGHCFSDDYEKITYIFDMDVTEYRKTGKAKPVSVALTIEKRASGGLHVKKQRR